MCGFTLESANIAELIAPKSMSAGVVFMMRRLSTRKLAPACRRACRGYCLPSSRSNAISISTTILWCASLSNSNFFSGQPWSRR